MRTYSNNMDLREIILGLAARDFVGMSEIQFKEFEEILDHHDNVISPKMLKKILLNFRGVSEEAAKFSEIRYLLTLEKHKKELPVEVAKKLGLFVSNDFAYPEVNQYNSPDTDKLIEKEIQRSIRGEFRRLNHQNDDVLVEPMKKILMNLADSTGITTQLKNIFFAGLEEQVRRDPKMIGDAREWFSQMKFLKRESMGREEKEEVIKKGKKSAENAGIFTELDAFFDE